MTLLALARRAGGSTAGTPLPELLPSKKPPSPLQPDGAIDAARASNRRQTELTRLLVTSRRSAPAPGGRVPLIVPRRALQACGVEAPRGPCLRSAMHSALRHHGVAQDRPQRIRLADAGTQPEGPPPGSLAARPHALAVGADVATGTSPLPERVVAEALADGQSLVSATLRVNGRKPGGLAVGISDHPGASGEGVCSTRAGDDATERSAPRAPPEPSAIDTTHRCYQHRRNAGVDTGPADPAQGRRRMQLTRPAAAAPPRPAPPACPARSSPRRWGCRRTSRSRSRG